MWVLRFRVVIWCCVFVLLFVSSFGLVFFVMCFRVVCSMHCDCVVCDLIVYSVVVV